MAVRSYHLMDYYMFSTRNWYGTKIYKSSPPFIRYTAKYTRWDAGCIGSKYSFQWKGFHCMHLTDKTCTRGTLQRMCVTGISSITLYECFWEFSQIDVKMYTFVLRKTLATEFWSKKCRFWWLDKKSLSYA